MEKWDITTKERIIKARVKEEFKYLDKLCPNIRVDILENRIVNLIIQLLDKN